MNKKIIADSWFISCNRGYLSGENKYRYYAKIDYELNDEKNTVAHHFDTYAEAYKWIENKVEM